jgi:hypothetical protein
LGLGTTIREEKLMSKQLTKIIAPLLALLIITSLVTFYASVTNKTATNQEKTRYFIENILPIDLSKYTLQFQREYNMWEGGIPSFSKTGGTINRNMTKVQYQLTSEESTFEIHFIIEKDAITGYTVYMKDGQEVILNKQYLNSLDAAKDFLEKYQIYTGIDSNDMIAMLDNVDLTKNSTTTTGNTRFTTYINYIGGIDQISFDWTYTIDGIDYTWLTLGFDTNGNYLITMADTRVLYTIGDTSINVSMEQAIDIALEYLKTYSYEMPDGSIVDDFKVSDIGAMLYTTPIDYVDYVLRPYWDVKLFLKEPASGSVFGITVFIWANTGEIISNSNMATNGTNYTDKNNSPDSTSTSQNQNILIISIAIVAIIAAAATATGILITKKKQK